MKFQKALRQWRDRKKITQRQAAARLAVCYGTYVNWEQSRKRPNLFTIQAIQKLIRGRS